MIKKDLVLGIDTSNYKTSLAVVDRDGNILFNHQKFLDVKHGERGLRQSEAFFQHEQRLPSVIVSALEDESLKERIGAVSVSTRPRPVEGSYMPVFTAGYGYAKVTASALGVPLFEFSHQEGHIEAIRFYSSLKEVSRLICFHFSGGTTEAVLSDDEKNLFEIVGGTKDIAFGQVLDRVGVSMGYDFPCGCILDEFLMKNCNDMDTGISRNIFSKVKVNNGFFNLSGIETQAQNAVINLTDDESFKGNFEINSDITSEMTSKYILVRDLFDRLAETIEIMTVQLSEKYQIKDFVFAGGVASSEYIKRYLETKFEKKYNIAFGSAKYSSDNAIGIALLGGKNIWH